MSGHSKWSSIKHQKGIKDARRGAAFTKYANLISVAARGGADPTTNFRLRLAITQARQAGVPNANIDRAIARGAGTDGGATLEEVVYEGYGPAGVAVIVETATDNRNRTGPDVRSLFSKYGGSLGTPGSVAYQFDQKGLIVLATSDPEAATLDAIEAGAEDIEEDGDSLIVYTAPTSLAAVQSRLADGGYEVAKAELSYVPKSAVTISDAKTAGTLLRLMEALDEHDDVTATYANFEIDEQLAGQLA